MLVVLFSLLDSCITEVRELDRRRAEFRQKFQTVFPDRNEWERLGFVRLMRWYRFYTRWLSTH